MFFLSSAIKEDKQNKERAMILFVNFIYISFCIIF